MKFIHKVKHIFSAEYANKPAIGNNLLLLWMYKFSYPFAIALSALGLSPNWITSLSLITSLAAAYVLVVDDGVLFFILFWGISILLDFCDGIVARKTNTLRATAFRYDHTSDLIKIFSVLLAAGVKYDEQAVWFLSSTAIFFFMFYIVLNHDLNNARQRQSDSSALKDKNNVNEFIAESKLRQFNKVIYSVLMTVNGHTLLAFLIFPFGRTETLIVLTYLTVISVSRSVICISALNKLSKL
jgi:phosphatidylglycerophosphate synthase